MKHYISLGSTCGIAYQFQELGIKTESLPFDWVKSPSLNFVTETIKNGFNIFGSYTDLEYCRESLKHHVFQTDNIDNMTGSSISHVYKNQLGVQFFHDFNERLSSETDYMYINFREKYTRRFDRFYDLFSSGNHLIFVRDEHKPTNLNSQDIICLVNLLRSMLTNSTTMEFILVIHNPKDRQINWVDSVLKYGVKVITEYCKIKWMAEK